MSTVPADYFKNFFQALDPKEKEPLDPDDPRRVAIYDRAGVSDPIAKLRGSIEWAALDSVHLFSGFRGTGKTTELRRLAADMRAKGWLVVYSDMREYLNLEDVVDVSHFLLSVAGAFSEALREQELLGKDSSKESYWTRARNFMTRTNVEFPALTATTTLLGDAGIKSSLKTDPSFREQLGLHLSGSMSAFVEDVHTFMRECVADLRARHGADTRILFILDSVEQISVDTSKHQDVAEHLVQIFSTHANDLRFEDIHVVYTVPPWLKVVNKGISGLYQGMFTLPCVKVRERDGTTCEQGIELMAEVISQREGAWRMLFEDEAALRRLILASGGYIRDLFRLLRACLLMKKPALSNADVELAQASITNLYMPISHVDARWLWQVAQSHEPELEAPERLRSLAGYFDQHLVLCYLNGREWYDIHPLIAADVEQMIARIGPVAPAGASG